MPRRSSSPGLPDVSSPPCTGLSWAVAEGAEPISPHHGLSPGPGAPSCFLGMSGQGLSRPESRQAPIGSECSHGEAADAAT